MTPAPPTGKHGPIVYFLRESHEGQIKIGTTTNYDARRRQLATSTSAYLKLLHWEPGGEDHEDHLHHRFSRHRVRRDREWFYPAEPLLEYIRNPPRGRGRPSFPGVPWRKIGRTLGVGPVGAWRILASVILYFFVPRSRRRARPYALTGALLAAGGTALTHTNLLTPAATILAITAAAIVACTIAGATRYR